MMVAFENLPKGVQERKAFLEEIAVMGKEQVIRYGVGQAVVKYCGACGDEGKGCAECKVYDFMQKSGVDTL
jgi:hypothetical protein